MTVAVRRGLDRTLEITLAILMAGMVLNVLWQIATRFVLGDPSSVTEELARFALVWLGILGAAYGFGKRVHLAVDVLGLWFVGRPDGAHAAQRALDVVIHICVAIFATSILIVGGARLVELTLRLDQTSAALGIPLGFVYSVLPLSGAVTLLYTALDLLELRSDRESVEGR